MYFLNTGDDAAVFDAPGPGRLAMTTDTYVVKPLFFPGGDIGRLAVCGTVNDLCVMGAAPLYLSAGFVLEEGMEIGLLGKCRGLHGRGGRRGRGHHRHR